MSFLREWQKNKYLYQISKPLLFYIKCGIIYLIKNSPMKKIEKMLKVISTATGNIELDPIAWSYIGSSFCLLVDLFIIFMVF